MFKNQYVVFSILSSLLFTFLFYKENIGLNLLIFELISLFALFAIYSFLLKQKIQMLFLGCTCLSALMVVVNNSNISIVANIFLFICTLGLSALPNVKNTMNGLTAGVLKFFRSQTDFFKHFKQSKVKATNKSRWRRKMHLVLIPIIALVGFVIIYAISSPYFAKLITIATNQVYQFFKNFTEYISMAMVAVAILGWIVSNVIFIPTNLTEIEIIENDTSFTLNRKRIKPKVYFKWDSLLDEYRIGLMLFGSLNILLLAMNVLDIKNVWFEFEWNGQFLKQFVHSGTYLLILSILLSVWITLHYFRGNLNFLKRNKTLKILAFVWLFQNIILAISVAIRNYWYIHHYALAYKRIGVIFFLTFVVIGIFLVLIKIIKLKTPEFLMHTIFIAGCCLLTIMTTINWDVIISRYNVGHANQSFVHYDYLAKMSSKALPELDLNLQKLQLIDSQQLAKPYNRNVVYMKSPEFHSIIQNRIQHFISEFPSRHWLSWNWADQKAFNQLNKKSPDLELSPDEH